MRVKRGEYGSAPACKGRETGYPRENPPTSEPTAVSRTTLLPSRGTGFDSRRGAPGFSQVDVVTDDAAGRWALPGISPSPAPVHSGAAPPIEKTVRRNVCALVYCFAHSGDAALYERASVALSVRSLLRQVASGRRRPSIAANTTSDGVAMPRQMLHDSPEHDESRVRNGKFGELGLRNLRPRYDPPTAAVRPCPHSAAPADVPETRRRTTRSPPRRTGFDSRAGHSRTLANVWIVPGDAAGRRVLSGISHFPRPCIPTPPHTHLTSPSSALKTSLLRAA
ncbi:hypothetical protein PR048_033604 [Dryococelus australis]|uniref:Uncharacterized protein n=1 Tax=Dryococelus australis TaxID=614101 RepID=A0ABQ9G0R1_9NEOP|nr:hypothetical protein PR048_033604 [Dryococelus australis]